MVFSSQIFIFFFLPAALILYYLTPRKLKSASLVCIGFVFYGWWRPDFVLLMMVTAIIDYIAAIRITKEREAERTGKAWLLVSVISNLGLLGYFKYANFGVATFNAIVKEVGGSPITWAEVLLPVGISFYTFKTMSYTIDVYWGRVRKARNFIDYLCFVTMFPELVAGPIIRYISVEDQLVNRKHSIAKFIQGIVAFQCGLAKKLLIADVLASLADSAFASGSLKPAEAWIGIVAYAFQIYFDFSGYSDMAIGLGLMIGFRFPINFDQPYRSASITEFWRRWHISLSTWLRDYLYIPLGGNRKSSARTYVNLMLTMLLGGLWHGANWTFIAWGAYQGLWLVIERLNGGRALWWWAPKPLRVAITFAAVLVGWVLFRASSMELALKYIRMMFDVRHYFETPFAWLDVRPLHVVMLVVAGVVTWMFTTTQNIVAAMKPAQVLAAQPLFALAVLQLLYQQNVPFLYFQF